MIAYLHGGSRDGERREMAELAQTYYTATGQFVDDGSGDMILDRYELQDTTLFAAHYEFERIEVLHLFEAYWQK